MNITTVKKHIGIAKKRIYLSEAYRNFQKDLNKYASFKVQSNTLSEDLVQDTFIKTWAYLAKGGEIIKMKAFLYHVLNDLIIDEYRRHKLLSLDMLIENGLEPKDMGFERTTNVFDGKVAVSLIGKLPRNYRKIMRMRYVQDLSLAEIARVLGKSKNTTAVQAHRGLEKLKVLYNHHSEKTSPRRR